MSASQQLTGSLVLGWGIGGDRSREVGRILVLQRKVHLSERSVPAAVSFWEGQNTFPELHFLKLTRHQAVNVHKLRIQFGALSPAGCGF